MAKILVADDEPDLESLIRQKFRKQIREKEYEFVFALNGKEAIERLQEQPDIDMVFTDINMPEMDGLTLLSELQISNPIVKAVIVSAYGDMANIRTAMNRGAFDFITKPVNFEDLELTLKKTMKHVHQLRQTLQAIKENNILKMYVDETVLKFMDKMEFEQSFAQNETIEATVVFIDICGFTSITESESPDFVVNLLNSYFELMVKEILAQNGYIDKFIGDAVMAVFKGEFHLDRAIDAALAVRNSIKHIHAQNTSAEFSPMVSIGIHAGEMITGNIGSSSLRRLDYTVIGDVVNTAQRLQSKAKPGQIIIAESDYLIIKDSFHCSHIEATNLKHKKHPISIYEVLD
ncbi:MAG: adenylate/guanylate cyclase domain-containing protein [Bacteroidota bacterium]